MSFWDFIKWVFTLGKHKSRESEAMDKIKRTKFLLKVEKDEIKTEEQEKVDIRKIINDIDKLVGYYKKTGKEELLEFERIAEPMLADLRLMEAERENLKLEESQFRDLESKWGACEKFIDTHEIEKYRSKIIEIRARIVFEMKKLARLIKREVRDDMLETQQARAVEQDVTVDQGEPGNAALGGAKQLEGAVK